MSRRFKSLLLFLLCGVVCRPVHADDAHKSIIATAKAATALVVLPNDGGSASAFCIDASGVFITNYHVVRGVAPGAKVTLVLNAGEENEQVCKATVQRVDKEDDLAVLKAEDFKPLTAISLGSSDQMIETQTITAMGYPFGQAMSLEKGTSPSISVNVAHITSMRKNKGKLELIQIDSQLNPGNSGGPVIDEKGKVIGIVSSGLLATGINFAVPVNKLTALLDRPELLFTPPLITEAGSHQPVDLTLHATFFGKPAAEMIFELELSTPSGSERTFRLQPVEGHSGDYTVRVVPIPLRTDANALSALFNFPDGSIHCTVEDEGLTADGQSYKLSQLSRLEFRSDAVTLTLRDGSHISPVKVTIPPVAAQFGNYVLQIDPAKATSLVLNEPDQGPPSVSYRISAKSKGAVLAETKGRLIGADAGSATASAGSGAAANAEPPPPLPAGSSPWVELLPKVDLARDTDAGKWQVTDGVLTNLHAPGRDQTCRLTIPVMPTGDYEVNYTFVRRTGTQDLCILFPCGGHGAQIWVGAFTGQLAELIGTQVKGRSDLIRIVNDHPYKVSLVVTHNGANPQITMKINGVDFLDWSGDPKTLEVNPERATRDGRTLGLAVYSSTTADFSNLRVRAITGEIAPYVEGK